MRPRLPTFLLVFCTLFTLFTSSRSSSVFKILLILGCNSGGRAGHILGAKPLLAWPAC